MDMTIGWECPECDELFSKKQALTTHLKREHKPSRASAPAPPPVQEHDTSRWKYKCTVCSKSYTDISSMYRHRRSFHGIAKTRKICKIICPIENCLQKLQSCTVLRRHITECHNIELEVVNYEFASVQEFKSWKAQMESVTMNKYKRSAMPVVMRNGNKKQFFDCIRSYNAKWPKQIFEKKYSNKVGKACPSRINVTYLPDGTCHVEFYKTHIGHLNEMKRGSLDVGFKSVVADHLRKGMCFDHILTIIHDRHYGEEYSRRNLVDEEDLQNIVQKFNIDYETMRTMCQLCLNDPNFQCTFFEDLETVDLASSLKYEDAGDDDNLITQKCKLIAELSEKTFLDETETENILNQLDLIINMIEEKNMNNTNISEDVENMKIEFVSDDSNSGTIFDVMKKDDDNNCVILIVEDDISNVQYEF